MNNMKRHTIYWNKVTPFSKYLALSMLVILPLLSFGLGAWYGAVKSASRVPEPSVSLNASTALLMNVEIWEEQSIPYEHFSFKTPIDIRPEELGRTETNEWRRNSNGTNGIKFLKISVPKIFEPMSNFQGAELTIGASSDSSAIANCLTYEQLGELGGITTERIHSTDFRVFEGTDAGAGNRYYSKSYRTIKNGKCYAIEYLVHSTNLGNYPEEFGLHEFNLARVKAVLDGVVRSFSFK